MDRCPICQEPFAPDNAQGGTVMLGDVESLAMSEGLDPDSNPLKDELDESYYRRLDQLERREETLTDFKAAAVTADEDESLKSRRPHVVAGEDRMARRAG